MAQAANKRCGRCHKELPLTEFSRHRQAQDGLLYMCRDCATEYNKLRWVRDGIMNRDRPVRDEEQRLRRIRANAAALLAASWRHSSEGTPKVAREQRDAALQACLWAADETGAGFWYELRLALATASEGGEDDR